MLWTGSSAAYGFQLPSTFGLVAVLVFILVILWPLTDSNTILGIFSSAKCMMRRGAGLRQAQTRPARNDPSVRHGTISRELSPETYRRKKLYGQVFNRRIPTILKQWSVLVLIRFYLAAQINFVDQWLVEDTFGRLVRLCWPPPLLSSKIEYSYSNPTRS